MSESYHQSPLFVTSSSDEPRKMCTDCKQTKPLTAFSKRKASQDGLAYQCKDCSRSYGRSYYSNFRKTGRKKRQFRQSLPDAQKRKRAALKFHYGLTQVEYDALLEAQNGVCAICGETETATYSNGRITKTKLFSVDHDHQTGEIRGLLCFNCNVGLGKFKENPSLLAKAIEYLS